MKKFYLRIQTYLRKLAGVGVNEELPLPRNDIEESLYKICINNPNGIGLSQGTGRDDER